ncbi:MAG: tRNA pseudouridine synthase A [Thermoguttaceae bacterium]|nr:tRNA pseudouridine synthase A [Thermoguttaceae bacterium]
MRCIKLTVAYDGTDYAGWQAQVESAMTGGKPTLQQTLERAIEAFCGEKMRILASGRTDAGVHALGQVVSVRTETNYPLEVWRKALNARLPLDVRILRAEEAAENFHPTHDTKSKRYRYQIDNGVIQNPFTRRTHWFIPQPLDVAAMQRAATYLVGTYDFASFESTGSPRSTSVRTVYDLSMICCVSSNPLLCTDFDAESRVLERVDAGRGISELRHLERDIPQPDSSGPKNMANGPWNGSEIQIEIEADGFLYNMVRAITGTLVQVGKGRWQPEQVAVIRDARNRTLAGPNAPPHGLCLLRVVYHHSKQGIE